MPGPLAGLTGQPIGLGVCVATGFLGGAHCLGICSPLVTTCATRTRTRAGDPALGVPAAGEWGLCEHCSAGHFST